MTCQIFWVLLPPDVQSGSCTANIEFFIFLFFHFIMTKGYANTDSQNKD